jgi:hypothetical protein
MSPLLLQIDGKDLDCAGVSFTHAQSCVRQKVKIAMFRSQLKRDVAAKSREVSVADRKWDGWTVTRNSKISQLALSMKPSYDRPAYWGTKSYPS